VSRNLPERVLVVRLGAIGDVVNALAFATAVKDASPATRVGWVVHPLAEPLVRGHPSVDRVHLWPRNGGLGALRRAVAELRAERYGLAVDLQRIQKSALLARLSGAPRVLGYDRRRAKEASWIWTRERIAAGPPEAHMVEQYLAFARHLGIEAPARLLLPVDGAAEAWAEEAVAEAGAAPALVNLGATKPANRWPGERFGTLAARIEDELGLPVFLTGSAADRETERGARAAPGGTGGVRSLVGRTSLLQLLALQRRARVFVACDTGPMHMAVAVGTPTVALFGPADPRRTGPYGAVDAADRDVPGPHRVVRERPPCSPCNLRRCDQPRHACMEDLSVARVLAAVRDALGSAVAR
jgi:lipopolysaccharide heptosyltransferase II